MRYKAKADWFTGVSMLVGIAAPAYIAITQSLPWMSAASVFAAILVFGVSYPKRYETTPDALIIKSGMTTRLIPYGKIKAVQPAADERLAIDYGIGNVLIAPQDAQAFMADIAARAPQAVPPS